MKKALLIAITNQAISSGTTFALTILLINQINQREFGIYALAIASILFFTGLGNALILVNVSINLGNTQKERRKIFVERATRSILIFGALAIILATTSTIIINQILKPPNQFETIDSILFGIAIGCYIALTLIKDLQTRLFYAEECESRVLAATVTYSATIFIFLLIPIELNTTIINDAKSALLLQCVALIAAISTGLQRLSKSTFRSSATEAITQFKFDLLHGADAGKANIINWLRSYGFNWITGIWGGPIAVAQMNASRLMITPPALILPAIGQPLLARLSRGLQQGKNIAAPLANRAIYITLIATLLYATPVLLYHDYIVKLLFGPQYIGTKALTYLWVLFIFFSSISTISTITLQALKEFNYLKNIALLSLAILLAIVYPLFSAYETPGILASVVISEAFIALILLTKVMKGNARR